MNLARSGLLLLLLPLLAAACQVAHAPSYASGDRASAPQAVTDDRPPWAAPPIERAVVVLDGRSGEVVAFAALLDQLARADAVFLGETHTDETTHRLELAVYEGLLARREGKVVLAMEMFERDVQDTLDAYLAGTIDEATFLAGSRPWGNYGAGYRPLIERARADGLPVIASNFPAPLARRVGMQGPEVLDTLSPAERSHAPAAVLPLSELYWRRVDNAVRSHRGMMPSGAADEDARLYSTQSLRDNAMGEACALALEKYPGHLVLHVNGGFHSAYWDGTVHQFRLRAPDAKVATVAIDPESNPSTADIYGAPVADFVAYAEARATDRHDGRWGVGVQRELRYRLHVPESASRENPVPLLVWLSDEGFTAADGLDLWRERLGGEVALAVIEPPYRAISEDMGEGGRWFWEDTFATDVATLAQGIARARGYLARNAPIDPGLVVVAGEGSGATVVAALPVLTARMDMRAFSFAPRHYSKIKDLSLPLPELRGDDPAPERGVQVFGDDADREWWTAELEEYAEVGIDGGFRVEPGDMYTREVARENALRSTFGLEPEEGGVAIRDKVIVTTDSPRARHWARLLALREGATVLRAAAPSTPGVTSAETFTSEASLPLCPGSFGGTTVVVVPATASNAEREAWLALEANDPIAAKHRFHRLRVATGEGGRALPAVLAKLSSEGRENVLVVPAVFCDDGTLVRELRREVRELEDRMTLHWLPGLGGCL